MMEEKELIAQIQKLREIKPEKNWVFLTKKEILGKDKLFLIFRPAYAGLFAILFLIGIFGVSQRSLPGEPLYYIKKIGEETQKVFVPEEEKPKLNLELANKKAEELKIVAQKKDAKKLVLAINEFQNSVSKAKEKLVKLKKIDKEILNQAFNLTTKVNEIENTLGTKPGEEEIKEMVKYLILDFENRTLTETQEENLKKAKEYFENENYQKALEELLVLSYNQ